MTLFARSFLLIALLLVISALASFQLYRIHEREPRARELAQQTVSTVNLTRAALLNADPFLRRELLLELNEREGIRITPMTASEKLEPLPPEPLFAMVAERVRSALGRDTRFAFERDELEGFWVSFTMDEDQYWVMLPRERFDPDFGLGWLNWGLALLGIALAGAWLIASAMARPLAAVTRAAGRLGRGEAHEPLAETGPRELRTVSAAFNRMAADLEAFEREQATVLAGISHDLRTPLSRLRLALEMSGARADIADGMGADVEEMDRVIGQFLDYARGEDEAKVPGELDALAGDIAGASARRGERVTFSAGGLQPFSFAPLAVRRAIGNLVNNALRHAGEPVEIATSAGGGYAVVEVLDRGPGIPASEVERLKRPFTRLDDARGGGGAGLGLAIVERIARVHGGRLEFEQRQGGGLVARLSLALR
jgi:two-component system, OmpR family, osmolarity sensor histidine kinase EnvZ